MGKIAGIDLDVVTFDFVEALKDWHNAVYHTHLTRADFTSFHLEKVWGGTEAEVYPKLLEFWQTDYFHNMQLVPGVREGLDLLESLGYGMIAITRRPRTLLNATQFALEMRCPGKIKDIYFTDEMRDDSDFRTKYEACFELGVNTLFEDDAETIIECSPVVDECWLCTQDWNKDYTILPANTKRFTNWWHLIAMLQNRL